MTQLLDGIQNILEQKVTIMERHGKVIFVLELFLLQHCNSIGTKKKSGYLCDDLQSFAFPDYHNVSISHYYYSIFFVINTYFEAKETKPKPFRL